MQVTDDFDDRGNGGLGSNWTTNTIWGSALQIVNHQLQAPSGNYAESLYTATSLGGAQYSEIKYISGLSSGVINLVVRAKEYTLGDQGDGYIGQLNGFESTWKIIRVDNDTVTVIPGASGSFTFANTMSSASKPRFDADTYAERCGVEIDYRSELCQWRCRRRPLQHQWPDRRSVARR